MNGPIYSYRLGAEIWNDDSVATDWRHVTSHVITQANQSADWLSMPESLARRSMGPSNLILISPSHRLSLSLLEYSTLWLFLFYYKAIYLYQLAYSITHLHTCLAVVLPLCPWTLIESHASQLVTIARISIAYTARSFSRSPPPVSRWAVREGAGVAPAH